MPKTEKPPLPLGTPVDINISEGLSVAQGVIAAAEYDDGWAYRIDVRSGDRCDMHRTAGSELWVCDFEVTPIGRALPFHNSLHNDSRERISQVLK